MIFEINPNYEDVIILDFDKVTPKYYTLSARRKEVVVDGYDVDIDDCIIAYSNKSHDEIVEHRSKLITDGYYKPTELYTRTIPNYQMKR